MMLNDSSMVSNSSSVSGLKPINSKNKRTMNEFSFPDFSNSMGESPPGNPNSGKLGKGTFGEVKLVQDKLDKKLYAMKVLKKSKIIELKTQEYLKREIKIQKTMKHPNIVKLHSAFEDENNVYIILEYAQGGSLFEYLVQKKQLPEEEAFIFFFQTALGIDYLHKHNYIHRDIKPENLLIDSKGNIKITDFGWSAFMEENSMRNTYCGTIDYMAPEMVTGKPHDEKVDLWSLGILLFEMTHGKTPFQGKNLKEVTQKIMKSQPAFKYKLSPECKNLILGLLKPVPAERLPLKDIFKHPFVQKHAKAFGVVIEKYIYDTTKASPNPKATRASSGLEQPSKKRVQFKNEIEVLGEISPINLTLSNNASKENEQYSKPQLEADKTQEVIKSSSSLEQITVDIFGNNENHLDPVRESLSGQPRTIEALVNSSLARLSIGSNRSARNQEISEEVQRIQRGEPLTSSLRANNGSSIMGRSMEMFQDGNNSTQDFQRQTSFVSNQREKTSSLSQKKPEPSRKDPEKDNSKGKRFEQKRPEPIQLANSQTKPEHNLGSQSQMNQMNEGRPSVTEELKEKNIILAQVMADMQFSSGEMANRRVTMLSTKRNSVGSQRKTTFWQNVLGSLCCIGKKAPEKAASKPIVAEKN